MRYDREYPPVTYGADYLTNMRWRYRTGTGAGEFDDPFRSGGSYGRGYGRADPVWRGSGDRRMTGGRGAAGRRPGTAVRDYERPYFSTASPFGDAWHERGQGATEDPRAREREREWQRPGSVPGARRYRR